MNHKGTKVILTERLKLRRIELSDADIAFKNWCSDPDVTKFLTWPTHKSPDETKAIFESWIKEYSRDDYYQWAICFKDTDEIFGSISVVEVHEKIDRVEIGYCISKKYWHQGYTSEALAALLPFFFEEVEVNSVCLDHDINNPNSGRVMKKCGLKMDGILRQAAKNNQGIVDIALYSMTKEDYFKN